MLRAILVCMVALASPLLATAGEFCQAANVEDKDSYILQVSNGDGTQTLTDYRDIFKAIYQPLDYCICDPGVKMTGWLFLTHKASCKELFEDLLDKLETATFLWPPPKEMPEELMSEFTLDGRVQVSNMYFSQKYNQNPKPHNWTTHHIESLITRAKNREEFSYAHETHYLYNVFEEYSIAGQQGIVLGSEMPWLEGILLAQGVDKVTTVEYQEIRSEHPSISTLTPKELAETWLASKLPQFDFAVSFSSYEHDGLGRYGDPIDPWGDIWDVHRITCFVKPDGLLFLGVPMGPDQVVWNAHRIYGPNRLPLLTANWEFLGAWDDAGWVKDFNKYWSWPAQRLGQPLIVLRNKRANPCQR